MRGCNWKGSGECMEKNHVDGDGTRRWGAGALGLWGSEALRLWFELGAMCLLFATV